MSSEPGSSDATPADDATRGDALLPPTPALKRVVHVATGLLRAPIGGIWAAAGETLVAESCLGLDGYARQAESMCASIAGSHDVAVVPDAREDPRVADSPLVTGGPGIRFCAVAPLTSPEGMARGALSVMDTAPRPRPRARDLDLLAGLASIAADEVELSVRVSQSLGADEAGSRLAAIVESSDDAIIAKSLDGTVLTWNAGAERLYGYSAEEIIGRPISLLVPPDRPTEVAEILHKLKRGEKVEHHETVRLRKDGTPVHVSVTVSPIRNAAAKSRALRRLRDINERQKAEEAWRSASEAALRKLLTPCCSFAQGCCLRR